MTFLRLFWEFFKTGLFAVGGGLATIPFLQRMGDATGWFTALDLADMIAVSESTPGPLGVNMAAYVGFTTAGPLGSVVATLGLIAPSAIIILIIARFLQRFRESRLVDSVFYGLRPASAALIAAAGVEVGKLALFHGGDLTRPNLAAILLAAAVFLCLQVKPLQKLHPIAFIALSAVVGVALKL